VRQALNVASAFACLICVCAVIRLFFGCMKCLKGKSKLAWVALANGTCPRALRVLQQGSTNSAFCAAALAVVPIALWGPLIQDFKDQCNGCTGIARLGVFAGRSGNTSLATMCTPPAPVTNGTTPTSADGVPFLADTTPLCADGLTFYVVAGAIGSSLLLVLLFRTDPSEVCSFPCAHLLELTPCYPQNNDDEDSDDEEAAAGQFRSVEMTTPVNNPTAAQQSQQYHRDVKQQQKKDSAVASMGSDVNRI
jgi:hypothetical protein